MMVRKESGKRNDCWADWENRLTLHLGLLKARESFVHLPPALITWCKVPQQRVAACKSVSALCSLESTFFKAKLHLLC